MKQFHVNQIIPVKKLSLICSARGEKVPKPFGLEPCVNFPPTGKTTDLNKDIAAMLTTTTSSFYCDTDLGNYVRSAMEGDAEQQQPATGKCGLISVSVHRYLVWHNDAADLWTTVYCRYKIKKTTKEIWVFDHIYLLDL